MQPAYWGCPPPMPPHFPPWGFNHWAPFPMGPPIYFQPRWDRPSPMYQEQHGKRIRFNDMTRRDWSPVRKVCGRDNAGRRLTWVRKSAEVLDKRKVDEGAAKVSNEQGSGEP